MMRRYQDVIIKIDPAKGKVVSIANMQSLYPMRSPTADCLNGIAYDHVAKNFYLTGKLWPYMYVVKFE